MNHLRAASAFVLTLMLSACGGGSGSNAGSGGSEPADGVDVEEAEVHSGTAESTDDTGSALKAMTGSYQLVSEVSHNRPPVEVYPRGLRRLG